MKIFLESPSSASTINFQRQGRPTMFTYNVSIITPAGREM
jgi:hypothetical protein